MARGLDISDRAGRIDGRAYQIRAQPPSETVAWYDAKQISANDGDGISTIPDSTGNGNDVSGGTPIYRESAVNGNPALEFDGDDFLDTDSFSANQPSEIFVVAQITDFSGGAPVPYGGFAEDHRIGTTPSSAGDPEQYFINAGNFRLSSTTADTNPHVLTGIFDGANSAIREDNSEIFTADAGANGLTGITMGSQNDQSNYFTGYICELVVVDGSLSDSERQDEEQRLADKWGITL